MVYSRPARHLAWLAAAVTAVFANALSAGFHFDDFADVLDNPAAAPATLLASLPHTVRPLLKASYALNAWLHGPWAPGYHALNILLHVLATGCVLVLLRRAAAARGLDDRSASRFTVIGTALWAVHPVVTETVTYVSGRSMGLSSLLMLAALVLATGVRHDAGPPAEATTGAWRRVGALGLCAFLAPLARETALVLPAVLVLWQWTLGPREPWRRGLSRHAPVWIGAGAAALVLAASSRHRHLVAFSLQVRDPLEALRGNVHAVTEMLSFWVRPWAISLDPPGPPALGWTAPETVAKAAGLAAAGVFAILGRRRWPLAAFATGWTLLQLVPTNSVVWRIDPVAVKPLYLASLGPAIAVAWVLGRAGRSPGLDGATLRPILATVLIGALAAGTVWRNAQYASPVALWDNTVRLGPGKARPRVNLGFAYLDAGRLDEAAREFAAALEVEPWNREARVGLAVVEVHRAPGPGAARRNSP